MILVNDRPQKNLGYYVSNWNGAGGRLPVQYKLESDLFPVNTVDGTDSITSVGNNGGFATFVLSSASVTYNKYDWVKISGMTNYTDGVYQIIDLESPTSLILDLAYSANDSGSLQYYYKNYKVLVRVYSGIPNYHVLNSLNPMSLVATMALEPDTNNIARVDVSGLIKDTLSVDYSTDTNDINRWTSFYVEYAEQYDTSDGTTVTTYTSPFTTDEYQDCSGEKVTNGDFSSGLTAWSQQGSGTAWAGIADAYTTGVSQQLYQAIDVYPDVPYNLSVDIKVDFIAPQKYSKIKIKAEYSTGIITLGEATVGNTVFATYNFNDLFFKEASFNLIFEVVSTTGSPCNTIIDNVSLQATDCTAYLFGINGVRQFQNNLGGNFGDYVANFNNGLFDNKFLTQFAKPVIFENNRFSLDIIIPSSSFGGAVDGNVYAEIRKYNGSTYVGREDIQIVGENDGVYNIDLSSVDLTGATTITCQLYRLPINVFNDGDSGTFDYTTDPSGDAPSDWNVVKSGNFASESVTYDTLITHSGLGSCYVIYGGTGSYNGLVELLNFSSSITCEPNKVYRLGAYVRTNGASSNFNLNTQIVLLPQGYTTAQVLSYTTKTINTSDIVTWTYIETVFDTGVNTSFDVSVYGIFNNVNGSGGFDFRIDDLVVLGAYEYLSELKTIDVNSECNYQEINLAWINNLGGWEYWTFTADKDYTTESADYVPFKRDIFADWDDSFVEGQVESDKLEIEAYWKVRVRSQLLTLDQIKAIGGDRSIGSAGIQNSLRVIDVTDISKPVAVLIDSNSITVRKDRQKIYSIEFDILYPQIEIQNQ